jgi:alanine racemase
MRNSSLIVHIDHFLKNLGEIRRLVGEDVKISASVKADAYGHGAVDIARAAQKGGADYLGIACPEEGAELRKAGISMPVLLYGLCLPAEMALLIDLNISAMVGDEEDIVCFEGRAEKMKTRAKLHLKVDTGMGRIGCRPEKTLTLAKRIAESPHLVLEGFSTHFPSADEKDRSFTAGQIRLFRSLAAEIRSAGIDPGILHASNSGGVLQYPEANFNMVRPGILLYGYYPSKDVSRDLRIRPVMELRARVLFIKRVPPGTPLSYGCTYKTEKETCIATVASGYADGYPRSLSNRGRVLIRGKNYPVVGRVTMDQIMVDIGADPEVRRYDEAVLFGPDPAGPNAEEIAELAGTIPYEITCGISRRIPRVRVD